MLISEVVKSYVFGLVKKVEEQTRDKGGYDIIRETTYLLGKRLNENSTLQKVGR